jgi:hypothetical protein
VWQLSSLDRESPIQGALGTWRPTQPYGGRLDKTGTYAGYGLGGEVVGKPGVAGVYTNQRLNLSKPWEGPRMICQGFKPDPGNLAVRHYRGASRTVRHGETVNPSCNRKSRNGNPSPTAGRARFLSQPLASFEAHYAPRSYPTHITGHSTSATLDRLSRLGDHVALGELGGRHGRRRLAAETWPRTI